MHLAHFTLQSAQSHTHSVSGNFTGIAPRQTTTDHTTQRNEILVASHNTISLWVIRIIHNTQSGVTNVSVECPLQQRVFGVVRSMIPFNSPYLDDHDSSDAVEQDGSSSDSPPQYVALGTDSGRLMVIRYDIQSRQFKIVHQETYGKPGCRRIVPGQMLAIDPLNRAILIGALEKQRFVYTLNTDSSSKQLTISSPIQAHSSNTIFFDVVALDNQGGNPLFASIEVDYSEVDSETDPEKQPYDITQKILAFHELDLGSNAVNKKERITIHPTSHKLIPIPVTNDCPGGVFVCSENLITYYNINHDPVSVTIPRREGMPYGRGLMIISHFQYRQNDQTIFLMQSELGDIYRVTLDTNQQNVEQINIHYFDTIPPSVSLSLLKRTDFVFSSSEFSDHKLYQFSDTEFDEEDLSNTIEIESYGQTYTIPEFRPRPLKYLKQIEVLQSAAPIITMEINDLLGEGSNQFYCLCGRGPRSSLRILKNGLNFVNGAEVAYEYAPHSVFSLKATQDAPNHQFLIISGESKTDIYKTDGEEFQPFVDSGLLPDVRTISCGLVGDDIMCQVHSRGIVFASPRLGRREWSSNTKVVEQAAMNARQVVIALSGGEIRYFEYDQERGMAIEKGQKDMGQPIKCLCIAPLPKDATRADWMALGFDDKTSQIVSLKPEDTWSVITSQAYSDAPFSMRIIPMHNGVERALYFCVSLSSGILQRTLMNERDGTFEQDVRQRFLGKAAKLSEITVNGEPALVAHAAGCWLYYTYQDRLHVSPLSHHSSEITSIANLETSSASFLAFVSGKSFCVKQLSSLGKSFNQKVIPLKYTPRRMCTYGKHIIIIETDHNALLQSESNTKQQEDMDIDTENNQSDENAMPESDFGAPVTVPNSSKWASYIHIMNPKNTNNPTSTYLALPENEAAFSMTICNFPEKSKDTFLLVGTGERMSLYPRHCSRGYIRTYRIVDDGSDRISIELIHTTELEDVPMALHPFQNRVLVGVKNMLRLYKLGQSCLLISCETRKFPNMITHIDSNGSRIYVSDVSESIFFVKYKKSVNALNIFADNTSPRWITCSLPLDYDTVAAADKFGNFFVSRVPRDISEDFEDGSITSDQSSKWMWNRGLLNGAPQKAQELVQFHVGDLITSMRKVKLFPGTPGIILYTTIMGGIGAFMPFVTSEDAEFFSLLEMRMRQEYATLSGRDHLDYRSSFHPCKNVVDGDLLECFSLLKREQQLDIAKDTVGKGGEAVPASEVFRRLENLRNFVL